MTENLAFDRNVLRLLVAELGADDVAEVLRAFLDDTRRKIDVLSSDVPDPAQIRQEAHSIKSSAGTFGFAELAGLALTLEQDALNMSPDELRIATAALRGVFEETTDFARSVLLASNMEIA